MDKCLNCEKELEHTEGKRAKKYCSDNCRTTHWIKTHKSEPKYVQFKTFKELSDKFNAVTKGKYETVPVVEKNLKGWEEANNKFISDIVSQPLSGDEPNNSEILKQIADIKAEKIPKERDTSMGRKVWANDQYKRIKELKFKLK